MRNRENQMMVAHLVKNIMIVDDEPDIRYTVKLGLEAIDQSYHVQDVKDGETCLSHLQNKEHPDLILLDIMMPGLNGIEVATAIRNNSSWKTIPIIFLTANVDTPVIEQAKILAQDVISKPYSLEDLKKRIDELVQTD